MAAPDLVPVETPVGTIVPYAGPINPWTQALLRERGWLLCDGSVVYAAQYPELWAVIKNLYGAPPSAGAGVFCLPDLRAMFLRGLYRDLTASPTDPGPRTGANPNGTGNTGNAVGSRELDAFQDHEHQYTEASTTVEPPTIGGSDAPTAGVVTTATTTAVENASARTSTETRPVNVAVNFLMKCRSTIPRAALLRGWVAKYEDAWQAPPGRPSPPLDARPSIEQETLP